MRSASLLFAAVLASLPAACDDANEVIEDGDGGMVDVQGGSQGGSRAGGAGIEGGRGGAGGSQGGAVGTAGPVAPGYKLDVLFVVSKTSSMADTQRRLAAAAPAFIAEMQRRGAKDLHLGVTTGDMGLAGRNVPGNAACSDSNGDSGRLQAPPDCGLANGRFMNVVDGKVTNADKDAGSILSCLLRVGTTGCTFSMPVNAAFVTLKMFLRDNDGFLRDDADVLVVVISNEDDCSALNGVTGIFVQTLPGQFQHLRCATTGHMCDFKVVEAKETEVPLSTCDDRIGGGDHLVRVEDVLQDIAEVKQLKAEARAFQMLSLPAPRVMLAALSGWPSDADLPTTKYAIRSFPSTSGELLDLAPVCGQGPSAARPALRLRSMAEKLGADGLFLSVCADDLGPALVRVAGLP